MTSQTNIRENPKTPPLRVVVELLGTIALPWKTSAGMVDRLSPIDQRARLRQISRKPTPRWGVVSSHSGSEE